jgi:hypothetical protein
MTGFYNFHIDGAGTAQLYALGELLRYAGYNLWDLGMNMPYKSKMGAVEVSRRHFVNYITRLKEGVDMTKGEDREIGVQDTPATTTAAATTTATITTATASTTTATTNNVVTTSSSAAAKAKHDVVKPIGGLIGAYEQLVQQQHQDEEDAKMVVINTRREKKLRWLTKKFGSESQQVKEYESRPIYETRAVEEGDLDKQQQSGQGAAPTRPLYELIPCRNLYSLPINLDDINWVNCKPKLLSKTTKKVPSAASPASPVPSSTSSSTTSSSTSSSQPQNM